MKKRVSIKKIPSKKNIARAAAARVRRDETLPFAETPPDNQYDEESKNALPAADLFSRFTADIIRKDVIFTR